MQTLCKVKLLSVGYKGLIGKNETIAPSFFIGIICPINFIGIEIIFVSRAQRSEIPGLGICAKCNNSYGSGQKAAERE